MARPPHRAEAHGCPSGQRRAEPGLQPGNGRAAVKPRLQLLFVGGGRHFATAPDPLLGNVFAAGSAVAWAFTVTGYRWLARVGAGDHGPIAGAAACGNLIVFLVCLPGALPLAAGRSVDWLIVMYLGVFQLGLAYVFLSRAITRVPALEASLFLLVEPVLSPVWA